MAGEAYLGPTLSGGEYAVVPRDAAMTFSKLEGEALAAVYHGVCVPKLQAERDAGMCDAADASVARTRRERGER